MAITLSQSFSQRLKALRLAKGWTQEGLRKRCGFRSQGRIGNYESEGENSRLPSEPDAVVLAGVLGCSVSYLLRGIEAVTPAAALRIPIVEWDAMTKPIKKAVHHLDIFWPVKLSKKSFVVREGTHSFLVVDPTLKPRGDDMLIINEHGRNYFGICERVGRHLFFKRLGHDAVKLDSAEISVVGIVVSHIKNRR